MGVYIPLFTFY